MENLNKIGLIILLVAFHLLEHTAPVAQIVGVVFMLIGGIMYLIPYESKLSIHIEGPFEVEEIKEDATKN